MNTNQEQHRDLIDEITRYLSTVDLFRSVGCEPRWRPESGPPVHASEAPRPSDLARRAH